MTVADENSDFFDQFVVNSGMENFSGKTQISPEPPTVWKRQTFCEYLAK
jgi:hypothetical protein